MPQVKRKHDEIRSDQEEPIRKKSKFNPHIISNFFRSLWEEVGSIYYSIRYYFLNQSDLSRAAAANNINLLQWAIQQGTDVNAVDNDGRTPLHDVINFGHVEAVRILLTGSNINVNAVNNSNRTPLHIAARNGYTEIIHVLLTVPGINVNAVNNQGCTPLHAMFASVDFNLAMTKQLLGAGADFSIKNQAGETAIKSIDLMASSDIRETIIAQYKRLLSEGPPVIESLKNKAATALFAHLNGEEKYGDESLKDDILPKELWDLYRFTPQRQQQEKSKGNYFRMLDFCKTNLQLTEDEKERYSFQL